jgi:hypothetical protein
VEYLRRHPNAISTVLAVLESQEGLADRVAIPVSWQAGQLLAQPSNGWAERMGARSARLAGREDARVIAVGRVYTASVRAMEGSSWVSVKQ